MKVLYCTNCRKFKDHDLVKTREDGLWTLYVYKCKHCERMQVSSERKSRWRNSTS